MTKKTKLMTARIFGIIFIIAGLAFSVGAGMFVFDTSKAISASGISYKYMENFEYYNFEELTVVDCYATSTYEESSFPDEWYYLVIFDDVDGNMYYASMMVTEEKDAFEELRRYAEDDEAFIGDCVIDAVVEYVCPIKDAAVFEEDILNYNHAIADISDGDIIDSGYSFEYSCTPENFESYADDQKNEDRYLFITGIVLLAIGVALIVIGFSKSLKEAKQQDENVFVQYGQGNNQYAETYYTPPVNNNTYN